MVDRRARDIAADTLEKFMKGSISNVEFERRFPGNKNDLALKVIGAELWFHYSDLSEHTVMGKHALAEPARSLLERCLLFLRSDLEFGWPPPQYKLWYGILRLFGFGRILKRREEKEMRIGDKEVWPFLKKAEYEEMSSKHNASENTI